MKRILRITVLSLAVLFAFAAVANAAKLVLAKGTQVTVAFDQALNSKTAKVGERVGLHVVNDVQVNGQIVIKRGVPVQGVITKVSKRKHYGINAQMRMDLKPVKSVTGVMVPLEASSKGDQISGKKSGQAAGATVGGAAILGPIGLVGGYFISGKPVRIKVGDTIVTEVTRDVVLKR